MTTVSLHEAQLRLAELVEDLGPGDEVVITRDNRPVAKLVSQAAHSPSATLTGGFMGRVNEELERLAALGPNWDGQGGRPLSRSVIDAARQVASSLAGQIAVVPAVVPMAKGNLQFEWNDGPRSLELEIETPSTIHYLKWHPEEGIEEEGVYDISDVGRSLSLIQWLQPGVSHV
jgi:prevent-host-death family protein